MKHIQKQILIAASVSALFFGAMILNSCADFAEVNTNTKVNNSTTPDALFASATKNLIDLHTSTNQNFNPFRLWAQHWTETTYTDEANYNVVQRSIPDRWFNILYARVLENYETAKSIEAETNPTKDEAMQANRLAILDIMEVYTYSTLVELFGDVPYTEANKIEITLLPVYDKQVDIYADLIKRLYSDIKALNTNSAAANFGSSDLIYSGNTGAWLKFANSMLLRMGMMIVDAGSVGSYTSGQLVKDALAGGVFTSNKDNALFQYLSANPNTNPLYVDLVQSGRQDYVACKTLIDTLIVTGDMRYTAFFTALSDGSYAGGIPGRSTNVNVSSYPSDIILNPTLPGVFLTYAEIEFLQAEAAARGIGGLAPSDAQKHYEAGMQASLDYWEALSDVSMESTSELITTAYAFPASHDEQLKAIAFQLWISLYNQGFEAWTQWRRLDYPTLTVAAKYYSAANNNGVATIPKRFTYPATEPGTNTDNYTNASQAIGGDYLYTPLFWDKYSNQWGTHSQYPALPGK